MKRFIFVWSGTARDIQQGRINRHPKSVTVSWSSDFGAAKQIRIKRLEQMIFGLHASIIANARRESHEAFETRRIRNENNYQNSFAD
jgi:hypothetical protein